MSTNERDDALRNAFNKVNIDHLKTEKEKSLTSDSIAFSCWVSNVKVDKNHPVAQEFLENVKDQGIAFESATFYDLGNGTAINFWNKEPTKFQRFMHYPF